MPPYLGSLKRLVLNLWDRMFHQSHLSKNLAQPRQHCAVTKGWVQELAPAPAVTRYQDRTSAKSGIPLKQLSPLFGEVLISREKGHLKPSALEWWLPAVLLAIHQADWQGEEAQAQAVTAPELLGFMRLFSLLMRWLAVRGGMAMGWGPAPYLDYICVPPVICLPLVRFCLKYSLSVT